MVIRSGNISLKRGYKIRFVVKEIQRGLGHWGVVAALLFAGCATGCTGITEPYGLLQPWVELNGAQMSLPSGALSTDFVLLQRPTAISVRGNDLYIVDAGQRRIFRYDRMLQTLSPFAENLPLEADMNIHAAPDLSVYITLPSSGKVLHFRRDGMPLPALTSPGNLARPISVAVDERSGRILVVDGLYDHIVVFSQVGGLMAIIKPAQVQAISAIATGPGGIYAIDRLAKRGVALTWEGEFRYGFGADFESDPGSIAVSRDNLVFIGDNFDNSVRVFRLHGASGATLAAKIGGAGVGGYNGIGGLAIEGDMLFVADSLNARIQTLLINPAAPDQVK